MRILMLTVALVAATLVGPTAAQALTYVEVYADDVTLGSSGCRNSQISVYGDWDGASSDVVIDIYDPYGSPVWTNSLGVDPYSAEATFSYPVCSGEETGRYTVEATVTEYDEFGDAVEVMVESTTFKVTARKTMKKARLSLRTRGIRQGKYRTAAVGTLNVLEAPRSWVRGKRVYLLVYVSLTDEWAIVDKQRTNRRGQATWVFKPNNFYWGMCSAPTNKVKTACTRVFRTRGGARTLAPQSLSPGVVPHTLGGALPQLDRVHARG